MQAVHQREGLECDLERIQQEVDNETGGCHDCAAVLTSLTAGAFMRNQYVARGARGQPVEPSWSSTPQCTIN